MQLIFYKLIRIISNYKLRKLKVVEYISVLQLLWV